jgi:AcrR family transcriptional regulator
MATVTRSDIIDAAGRLFAERGYHGTSMRDLGNEVGLLGSSIYSHVNSKAEILTEVIDKGAKLFQASADAALAAPVSAPEKLELLISGHIDVVMDHANEVKTFLYESRFLAADQRAVPLEQRNTYEAAFRSVFVQGAEAGDFKRLDPVITSILTLSILNAIERWFRDDGRLDRGELTQRIVGFTKASLEKE